MRPYWALLSARIRVLLQYRAAALAGLITQLFWGGIRVMVFTAFYQASSKPLPMSLEDTITYLWLIQGLLLLLPFRPDVELQAMIRDGSVAYDLTRPISLYWFWFSRAMALRLAPTALRAIPLGLIAGLFFGLKLPPSAASALAFLISLAGALILSAAISTLMTITMMWTLSGEGVWRMLSILTMFFSGSYVPLPLFPQWSQPVLHFLPFRGVMDTPFRLYVGHLTPQSTLAMLLHQLGWAALFMITGQLLLKRGIKRLVVQGG